MKADASILKVCIYLIPLHNSAMNAEIVVATTAKDPFGTFFKTRIPVKRDLSCIILKIIKTIPTDCRSYRECLIDLAFFDLLL
jgi:hypothetical protein